jgi:hypothetical protein
VNNKPQTTDRPPDEFDEFWSIYPRHKCKKAARIAYGRARKHYGQDEILTGAMRYAEECCGTDPKYIAHPATWLNGERWTDEPDAPVAKKNGDSPLVHNGTNWGYEDWRRRVKWYQEKGMWMGDWGFPPDDPGCYAPATILAEFGFRNIH